MLLAIDIGNTNIVIGGWNKDTLLFEFRLQSDIGRTVDEYRASISSLLQLQLGAAYTVSAAIISSVVPPLTGTLVDLVKQTFSIDPLIVGVGTKTGIAIRIADPASVGADRIVNSVAAKTLYGKKSIVVDFGTATTFDYINDNGDYEGGIIAPGLHTSLESLVSKTAKLPRIELAWPKTIIGKSTVAAMQSGAMVGYVCMVDGVLAQIEKEVGKLSVVIATGGLGGVITEHSERIDIYDGTLTLKGMQLIAQMNGIG
jgi:type III pantothenate kinase